MGCRCAERAVELRTLMQALGRRDLGQAKASAGFVLKSGAEDAAAAGRQLADRARSAAAARLGIRRR